MPGPSSSTITSALPRPRVRLTRTSPPAGLNEIAFNSVLLKEMRTAAMLRKYAATATGEGAIYARMRVHRIASDVMLDLGYSSKLIAEWPFFCMLRDEGRKSAAAFLEAHGKDLGVRSTFDLDTELEGM